MTPFITARQIAAAAAIAAAINLPAAFASPGDRATVETGTAATAATGTTKADRLPVRPRSGCAGGGWPYVPADCLADGDDGDVRKAPRTIVVDHNVAERTTVVARMPAAQ